MTLRLYNTLNRAKEDFVPFDAAHVRMYVCGPTVYDRAHIGNARPLIVFDVLYRLLREIYGCEQVTYVRNITDVDDKINARAAERGVPIRVLTDETARAFEEDVAALGCLPPTVQPRATEHISEMKTMIEALVERGIAYVAQDHALFSVSAMNARGKAPKYGSLSRRSLDEMIAGARVEVAPYKREPTDFVLWKPSKLGEPAWESPCEIAAKGRPGWHIECSAMSFKHLVEEFAGRLKCEDAYRNAFDIHGGGIDLVFPHHENEIAQSCCALDSELMARVWMHNGFLQVEGEKMAKSAGNFVTIRELLEEWPGEVVRFAMLKSHYRQPIDFKRAELKNSAEELSHWARSIGHSDANANDEAEIDSDFLNALMDDLNTPEAITILRQKYAASKSDANLTPNFLASCRMLGLLDPRKFGAHLPGAVASQTLLASHRSVIEKLKVTNANGFAANVNAQKQLLEVQGVQVTFKDNGQVVLTSDSSDSEIEDLVKDRETARAAKNWAESDRIRNELAWRGVVLKDNKDGTTTVESKR